MDEPRQPTVTKNTLVALLPALFAWQLHGIWVAIGLYVLAVAILAALSWTFLLNGWSLNRLSIAKWAFLISLLIGLAVLNSEISSI